MQFANGPADAHFPHHVFSPLPMLERFYGESDAREMIRMSQTGARGESPLLLAACRLEQLLLYALDKNTPPSTLSPSARIDSASPSCTFRTERCVSNSAPQAPAAETSSDKPLLRALGGFLPAGLVGNGSFVSSAGAARPSISARFAAISEFRLVVWWISHHWRARHEQLSADDCHQRGKEPHQTVWMD